jgi:hypothetical protein
MFFRKTVSLSGIAKHLLARSSSFPTSPKPVVQKANSALDRHMSAPSAFESLLGASFDSFKETDTLKKMPEIFSSIVVSHLVKKNHHFECALGYVSSRVVSSISQSEGSLNFFLGKDLQKQIPNDLDCTGLAVPLIVNSLKPSQLSRLGQLILRNVVANATDTPIPSGTEGVLQVYFPENREHLGRSNRVDPCVCVNGIYGLMHLLAKDAITTNELSGTSGIEPSLNYILAHLDMGASEKFDKITRYYPHPEEFLFFLSRLVGEFSCELDTVSPDFSRKAILGIHKAIRSRCGEDLGNTLAISMRLIVDRELTLGQVLDDEKKNLMKRISESEGLLSPEAFFGCGQASLLFGSSGVTTAFALAGLDFQDTQGLFVDFKSQIRTNFYCSSVLEENSLLLATELAPDKYIACSEALAVSNSFLRFSLGVVSTSPSYVENMMESVSSWKHSLRSGSIPSDSASDDDLQSLPEELLFLDSFRDLSKNRARLTVFCSGLHDFLDKSKSLFVENDVDNRADFYKHILATHYDLWLTLNFEDLKVDPDIQRILNLDPLFGDLGQLFLAQHDLVAFASGHSAPFDNLVINESREKQIPISDVFSTILTDYTSHKKIFSDKLTKIERELDEAYQSFEEEERAAEAKVAKQRQILSFFRKVMDGHESYLLKTYHL